MSFHHKALVRGRYCWHTRKLRFRSLTSPHYNTPSVPQSSDFKQQCSLWCQGLQLLYPGDVGSNMTQVKLTMALSFSKCFWSYSRQLPTLFLTMTKSISRKAVIVINQHLFCHLIYSIFKYNIQLNNFYTETRTTNLVNKAPGCKAWGRGLTFFFFFWLVLSLGSTSETCPISLNVGFQMQA